MRCGRTFSGTAGCRAPVSHFRAIGHLFEAEDESQEWPDLHAAIRHVPKAYQTDGTMPDWEFLATAVANIRQMLMES